MNWKMHLFFGAMLGAVAGYLVLGPGWLGIAFFAIVAGICALLPDIDLRKSKVSQIAYMAALFAAVQIASDYGSGNVFKPALFLLIILAFALIDLMFRPRHRGIMHSILALLGICAAAWLFIGETIAMAAFIGYASHLVADGCFKIW